MTVIAYAYDADHHCESCMYDYARSIPFSEYKDMEYEDAYSYNGNNGIFDLKALVEGGIIRDRENNEIHPLFSIDEWYNIGEGTQTLNCSDCGALLDTYEEHAEERG